MFAFLQGQIHTLEPNRVELDVNGVGYEVFVPERTTRKLQAGREMLFYTHCYIREDAFHIYGFSEIEDKKLFRLLLGINGVGPKVALAILSALSPQQLAAAVQNADTTAFTRVNGVGKKGAQRIILDMKNKMGQEADLARLLGSEGEGAVAPEGDDAIEALCALGCTPAEAAKAVRNARAGLPVDAPADEVVRTALRSISKV